MSSSVPLTLALASIQAIVQVAVICVFGHILARYGYLNQQLQRGLSRLSIQFFTPCLLFANTAESIDTDNVLLLWPLPMYFAMFALVAWLLAAIGSRAMGFTPSQRRFAIATLMFPNTNSLPIGLTESLVLSAAYGWLRWHETDTREDVAARGIAYIVFYAIMGNLVRWSYGMYLLENDDDDVKESGNGTAAGERQALLGTTAAGFAGHKPTRSQTVPVASMYSNMLYSEDIPEAMSLDTSHQTLAPGSTSSGIDSRRVEDVSSIAAKPRADAQSRSWLGLLKPILSPPLLAALIGLFVAVTPLRRILVDDNAILRSTLFAAIQGCGEAAVPLILVCLGAQLTTLAQNQQFVQSADHLRASHYPCYGPVVAFVVTSRLIILPALTLGMTLVTLRYMGPLQHDPMFIVTVMLLGSCPTAVNLMAVCQANGCFEQPMGRVLMWEYIGSVFTLAAWCVCFLWAAQSMTQ